MGSEGDDFEERRVEVRLDTLRPAKSEAVRDFEEQTVWDPKVQFDGDTSDKSRKVEPDPSPKPLKAKQARKKAKTKPRAESAARKQAKTKTRIESSDPQHSDMAAATHHAVGIIHRLWIVACVALGAFLAFLGIGLLILDHDLGPLGVVAGLLLLLLCAPLARLVYRFGVWLARGKA